VIAWRPVCERSEPLIETVGLDFERSARDTTLPYDRLQRTYSELGVIRNWHGHGPAFRASLHDDMAAALTNHLKTVMFEDPANIPSGEDAKFTHGLLRSE